MGDEKPLSRVESQERTRRALLAAADRRFETQGYLGTTLSEIASDAGLTKGAVYANFRSKADLFLAVRQEWSLGGIPSLAEQAGALDDLDEWIDVIADWVAALGGEGEQRQRAYSEFLVEAAATPAAARAFIGPYRSARAMVATMLAAELSRLLQLAVEPEHLEVQVDIFFAAVAGLAFIRTLDHDISIDAYRVAVRNLILGTMEVAAATSPS